MSEVKIGDIVWLRQANHSKVKMGVVRTLTPEGYALVVIPGPRSSLRQSCLAADLKPAEPEEIDRLWPNDEV